MSSQTNITHNPQSAQHVAIQYQDSSARPPTEAYHQHGNRRPAPSPEHQVTAGSAVDPPPSPTRRLSSTDPQLYAQVTSTATTTTTTILTDSIVLHTNNNSTSSTENENDIKGRLLETFIQKSWTAPPPAYTAATAATPSMGAISNYYQRRLARANTDNMRFQTTTRPTLTPFGQRVINISEHKLYALEELLGGRDKPTLLRGVLVREAVKSAWRSVETGQQVEVNDWQSTQAMGLDVIGEEEEEEEAEVEGELRDYAHEQEHESIIEQRSERWFEELVQSFGEDDGVEQHEWIESQVGDVDHDDFDDDAAAAFEHYTLPSPPPPSPLQVPASPSSSSSTLSSIESSTSSVTSVDDTWTVTVEVDIVETPDYDDEYDDEWDCEALEQSAISDSDVDSIPSAPLLSAACSPSSSPIPLISLTDDELDCDDLCLPPPLHRCSSPCTDRDCDCNDDDQESDSRCVTPTSSCDELSVGDLLGPDQVDHVLEDPGDTVRLAFDRVASKPDDWQTWHHHPPTFASSFGISPGLGLGLDITVDTI